MQKGTSMNDSQYSIQDIKNLVNQFVSEREWQQFHSPKNLSMAIAIEAAELMEPFRFVTSEESKEILEKDKEQISTEIADVLIATIAFCNLHNIDISHAITKKLESLKQKYPVDKAKGSNKKYHHYDKNIK